MKYDDIIDAETWAFIRQTEEHYPPDAAKRTVAQQREVYDRLCRSFFQGYPEGVTTQDRKFDHVPTRSYSCGTSETKIIYFHGGGYMLGGLDSHDDICAEICEGTGFDVIAVDYRLAPEHRHPAMFDDAFLATSTVLKNMPCQVILCGDSAGGNLAAAVAHAMRGKTDRIAGQVLIYPTLGGNPNQGSYALHAHAPLLTRADMLYYASIRSEGAETSGDPSYAPLQDTDFSALPATVAFSAECDPLAGDAQQYAASIASAGGKAIWVEEAGLVHGYLRARTTVTRARDSFNRIIFAIRTLGAGHWPYN